MISVYLRVTLLIASVCACIYVARKLRKSQMGLMDSLFWILLSVVFVLLSVFPKIAAWGADLFGVIAPANFIFLVIIFLLLLRVFTLTIHVAQIEDKLRNLVEELAIRENLSHQNEDKED